MKSLKGLWCVLFHARHWRYQDWRMAWHCDKCDRDWRLDTQEFGA